MMQLSNGNNINSNQDNQKINDELDYFSELAKIATQ
jgi:hypothetical protein